MARISLKYFRFTLFLIIAILSGCMSDSSIYPEAGRNTIDLFGDGRFEIFAGGYDETRYYCLYDRMEGREGSVEDDILNYKEVAPCVYVIGTTGYNTLYDIEDSKYKTEGEEAIEGTENSDTETEGSKTRVIPVRKTKKTYYTKVNYETGEIQQETELSAFSEEDIAIFEELSKSESAFENRSIW